MVDPSNTLLFGLTVVWVRSQEAIQQLVDRAPKAKWYFSDGFDAYRWLWYHYGRFEVAKGKSETYSVEADNAELRHYLARLARRTRCFSRCPYALECAIRSYVYAFNHRQLYKHRYPLYPANVMDFVSPHN